MCVCVFILLYIIWYLTMQIDRHKISYLGLLWTVQKPQLVWPCLAGQLPSHNKLSKLSRTQPMGLLCVLFAKPSWARALYMLLHNMYYSVMGKWTSQEALWTPRQTQFLSEPCFSYSLLYLAPSLMMYWTNMSQTSLCSPGWKLIMCSLPLNSQHPHQICSLVLKMHANSLIK